MEGREEGGVGEMIDENTKTEVNEWRESGEWGVEVRGE
jgi:hypothetical protein